MKIYLTALALTVLLATPAAAEFAGTESRGQPVNSSVYAPAIDPDTGRMPTMHQGSRAKAQAIKAKKVKKKKVKRID
jgi:hypothetical protein